MIWFLAGCAWAALAFWVWALCVAAGRADRAAELIAAAQRDTPPASPARPPAPVEPPIPSTVDVWRAFPDLTFPQARAVAARRLQEKRTPGALG